MTEPPKDKMKMLEQIIKQLHDGVPPHQVKEQFKHVLESTSPEEIARIEQELVKEGMPREELQKLCDVHLAVFGDQLQEQNVQIPPEHPLSILMEEHKILTQHSKKLETIARLVEGACDFVYVGDALEELQKIAEDFVDAEKHYLREENVLFPVIEKHGITEPPAIMWIEHNQIREKKKDLQKLAKEWNTMTYQNFKSQFDETSAALCSLLPSHFSKENSILFPAALHVVTEDEWVEVRKEFDEIGYWKYTPRPIQVKVEVPTATATSAPVGEFLFENGNLSKEEIEGILDSIPVDITFIDKDDRVKFFSKGEKRIFLRTKAVLGRKVQMCHPQKSVHIVNQIIEAFRSGKKDSSEFWITMNDRLIHIRYFAVRDKKMNYLGTMEVTQDLTAIKKIEGQKRLLDWEG